jgi:hypothetical protein
LIPKCDLDLDWRGPGIAHDTSSHHYKYLQFCNFKTFWTMKKLWTGHKLYPLTYYMYIKLWPPSVTLTLEVGVCVFCITHCLIIVNVCKEVFLKSLDVWISYGLNRTYTPSRQCWPFSPRVTLNLEKGAMVLRMTHRVIKTNICAKLFQFPLVNGLVIDSGKPNLLTKWPIQSIPLSLLKRIHHFRLLIGKFMHLFKRHQTIRNGIHDINSGDFLSTLTC